ncbi:putative cytochrome P450 [Periconia macrospinosa]|uniref:Putative cytochrome P450 n=1 Tax=Periconia macrospinosa TaxID=97972 RepID=A0A2V1DYQ9_9PLEO|nr:putative cytochrome P450 [Periconia macrospinosa]
MVYENPIFDFTTLQIVGVAIICSLAILRSLQKQFGPPLPPFVGYRSWLEPTFLVRLKFLFNAKDILTAGYSKYKGTAFRIRRNDVDVIVLPNKYIDEIRLLPSTTLSNSHAQFRNIKGEYTYASTILHGNLHTRVFRNQLTPNLGTYIARAKVEFDYAFPQDFSHVQGWTEVDIQGIIRSLVARMTSVVFLGYPLCRHEEWLRISVQYPMDTFQTAFTIRLFPTFLQPIVAMLLPSRRRLAKLRNEAEELLGPVIRNHTKTENTAKIEVGTLLEWMMDNGSEPERQVENMTSRQCILTLASIHTTAMSIGHALFDLCAHPEYLQPLREEIEEVTSAYQGDKFISQGLPCLEKLDSFLTESQRFHPPILMSPQRMAMKSITLRDGTQIPQGSRLGFPSFNIVNDPAVTPNPALFDGFRSYNDRRQTGSTRRDYMTYTDKNHLVFGHGKQACPGRYFAAAELKIIMARILEEFDVRLVDGKETPRTMFVDENCFLDPDATVMLRRRGG